MTATIVYADGITEYPRVTVSGDGVARASYWMGRKASGQLWERVSERSRMRNPGGIVYVYGRSIATVIHPDNDGAIVREHDDNGETWFPWSDLTGERIK